MKTLGLNEQIIKRMLELHQKWLDREPEGVQADFTGMNLSNFRYTLHDVDLSWAIFANADLHNVDLSWSFLNYTDFSGANLQGANLSCCTLLEADLRRADLRKCNLKSADLSNAIADYVELSSANLTGADLSNVNLIGANLSNANLTNACIAGADLTGTNLTLVDFTDVEWYEPEAPNDEEETSDENHIIPPPAAVVNDDEETVSLWIAVDTSNRQRIGTRDVTVCSHAFHDKADAMTFLGVGNTQIVEIKVKDSKAIEELNRLKAAYDLYISVNEDVMSFEEFKRYPISDQTQLYLNIVDKTGYKGQTVIHGV